MSAAQKAGKPETIKSLRDWAKSYNNLSNLEFDPVTRVPTVYVPSRDGSRVVAKTFPLTKEYDIPTVLTNPSKFDPSVVATATTTVSELLKLRYGTEEQEQIELEEAMTNLMAAWRTYRASPSPDRGLRMLDILKAEKVYRDLEENKAISQRRHIKTTKTSSAEVYAIHFDEFTLDQRPLPV